MKFVGVDLHPLSITLAAVNAARAVSTDRRGDGELWMVRATGRAQDFPGIIPNSWRVGGFSGVAQVEDEIRQVEHRLTEATKGDAVMEKRSSSRASAWLPQRKAIVTLLRRDAVQCIEGQAGRPMRG